VRGVGASVVVVPTLRIAAQIILCWVSAAIKVFGDAKLNLPVNQPIAREMSNRCNNVQLIRRLQHHWGLWPENKGSIRTVSGDFGMV
jgi:hypothetical protein